MVTTVVRHCAGLMNGKLLIVNCARKANGPFLELLVQRQTGRNERRCDDFLSEEFATKKGGGKVPGLR